MQEDEFYAHVQEVSHLETTDRAQAASEAVLATLGEALTGGEAEDVAAQLPGELARILEDADHDGTGCERDEFMNRVREHVRDRDIEADDAERFTEAVTDVIAVTLTNDEVEDLNGQLDAEIQPLFENVDVDPEWA
ncbi:DUF2267 domain-containing protein [Saliphagus sp. GCM10025334]